MSKQTRTLLLKRLRKTPKEALVATLCMVCEQSMLSDQVDGLLEVYTMMYRGSTKAQCQAKAAEWGIVLHG